MSECHSKRSAENQCAVEYIECLYTPMTETIFRFRPHKRRSTSSEVGNKDVRRAYILGATMILPLPIFLRSLSCDLRGKIFMRPGITQFPRHEIYTETKR